MKKKEEKSRFAHLAKEAEAFKAGKKKLKVTTKDSRTLKASIHIESYEEMRHRHQAKKRAALEFKKLRQDLNLTQGKLAMALRVSKRTLEGWEAGRFPIDPPAELLARVMLTHPEIKQELIAA
ncbi:MAG: helix-turn-helix domain-containing protein [Fibrobacterota bacterium]|nr:helix-turn-helix domain-containing protein [Fibrobacterota bacterium]